MEIIYKGLTVPNWVLMCSSRPMFIRKYPKCPKTFRPHLSAQAQKFGIFGKKLSLCVRSPWFWQCIHAFFVWNASCYSSATNVVYLLQLWLHQEVLECYYVLMGWIDSNLCYFWFQAQYSKQITQKLSIIEWNYF